jgi:MFS family permease
MMAGVYGVQGAWWPVLALHLNDLGVPGRARGAIFGTLAMASLVTPVIAGQIADRRLAAQRLLALIYALGTVVLVMLARGWIPAAPLPLFVTFLGYWLMTAPASGLASTIAFRNLMRPAAQFGRVRMWGTVGWMAAGWVVTAVMGLRSQTSAGVGAFEAFGVAAVVSAALSLYCLTLPDTPPWPISDPTRRKAWELPDASIGELLRRPGVGVLLAVALGVSLTTPFVYQVVPAYLPSLGLPRSWVALAMSLGQVLEIASLAVLPRLLGRLGFRRMLMAGMSAWVAYHGVMTLRPPLAVVLAALPIQGLAIALFHIAAAMYLDRQAPAERRATTQGLYLMTTTGLGNLLGSLLGGEMVERVGGAAAPVFGVPLAIDAVMLAVFVAGFPREGDSQAASGGGESIRGRAR